jgi:hypothetical protein
MQEGNLHKWFKGSKSKDGKSGWVNVVTGGTCASDKPGEGTPKCVSSSKRASMTPAERKSAQSRKKKADPNQQSKSGAAKPTYVSTDKPKKKMKEEMEINEADKKGKGSGKKDACYHKVKASASVWPSAYASGRLVQCRKKGAANYGKSKKNEEFMALPEFTDLQIRCMEAAGIEVEVLDEKCWVGYTQKGMKKKGKKVVPNCVPVGEGYAPGDVDQKVGAVTAIPKSEQDAAKARILAKTKAKMKKEEVEIAEAPKYDKQGLDKFDRSKRMIRHKQNKYGVSTLKQSIMTGANHNIDNEKKAKMKKEEVEIEEATRVPAQNGNVYLVGFTWRGKYMMMKLFFPEVKRPSRNEVKDALEKIYPGCHLQRFDLAPYNPSEPMINVGVNEESSKSCSKGEYYCNDSKKCKPVPKGHHVMRNGDLMKDEDHDEGGDMSEGAAWQRKEGKNKEGGLNEKGRKSYERENPGSDLKAPQPEGGPRKKSFCARMGGVKGPMKKPNGEPTRKALALRKWKC